MDKFDWYQTIDFGDGLVSKGYEWCGDPAWENIKRFLPESLEGMRILDLGCNAGIFCVRAALMGAKECVGIESNDWKDDYLAQAEFVKEFFEKKHSRQLPIKYIQGRMEDVLFRDLSGFDYCFAIASLYYTTDPGIVMTRLGQITKNLIMRLRDEPLDRFVKLADEKGFRLQGMMRENWTERLGIPADDFYLFHYAK